MSLLHLPGLLLAEAGDELEDWETLVCPEDVPVLPKTGEILDALFLESYDSRHNLPPRALPYLTRTDRSYFQTITPGILGKE